MQVIKNFFYSLLIFSCNSLAFSEDKIVKLTSLEWPPYAGKDLPQQGTAVATARRAFAAMGYQLEVTFFPWSRAINQARNLDSQFVGYFPEYYSKQTARQFNYSHSIGSSLLGFAQRKGMKITWNTLSDLSSYQIGIVQDYINTEEFDLLVKEKKLQTSLTISDTNNLKKLISGRVDLAIIDNNVMDYLLSTNKSLKSKAHLAEFNSKVLEDKQLFICFKVNDEGTNFQEIFNQGLKLIKND